MKAGGTAVVARVRTPTLVTAASTAASTRITALANNGGAGDETGRSGNGDGTSDDGDGSR